MSSSIPTGEMGSPVPQIRSKARIGTDRGISMEPAAARQQVEQATHERASAWQAVSRKRELADQAFDVSASNQMKRKIRLSD
jgi:hypothetical protein